MQDCRFAVRLHTLARGGRSTVSILQHDVIPIAILHCWHQHLHAHHTRPTCTHRPLSTGVTDMEIPGLDCLPRLRTALTAATRSSSLPGWCARVRGSPPFSTMNCYCRPGFVSSGFPGFASWAHLSTHPQHLLCAFLTKPHGFSPTLSLSSSTPLWRRV